LTARRARKRRSRPFARGFLALALILGVAAAAAWLCWVQETTALKLRVGDPPVRLLVAPGANADSIGRELHSLGLTRHPLLFRLLARVRGASGQLKAGDYSLAGPLSLEGILRVLVHGEVSRRTLTIPEGRTLDEIAAIVAGHGLDAAAFRAAAADPTPVRDLDPQASDLEGYLFPDTYDVSLKPDAERLLVVRMTQRLREVLSPELARVREQGLTVRQLLTLASIVELETARVEERPRIAAVFLNRLRKGMLLQTDPSVIYALKKAGRWDGNIRRDDLLRDSPYNTYRRAGLPPGPLGCPGREAILAVLAPAPTRDLYFVSRNDGTHEFNESLAEHNRAVDRYQRRRARS
jgi:UPF0755 protein